MSKGTIVVTGANGGLGSAIASQIASSSYGAEYHGVYTVRNPKSADALNGILQKARKHPNDIVAMDLSSLIKVREAAASINRRVAEGSLPPIRALILNAGFQEQTVQTFSEDGFDMSFQVNYLAHFLFTLLLLQSMDKESGRILVIGSWSHDFEDPQNDIGFTAGAYNIVKDGLFHTTEGLAKGTEYSTKDDPSLFSGYRRYGASKLCEVMFMHELQSRLDQDPKLSKVSVLAMDPGAMPSSLLRRADWFKRVIIIGVLLRLAAWAASFTAPNGTMRSTRTSAADALRACFDTKTLDEHPKGLYLNGSKTAASGKEAKDQSKRSMLWHDSVQYVKLQESETALINWK